MQLKTFSCSQNMILGPLTLTILMPFPRANNLAYWLMDNPPINNSTETQWRQWAWPCRVQGMTTMSLASQILRALPLWQLHLIWSTIGWPQKNEYRVLELQRKLCLLHINKRVENCCKSKFTIFSQGSKIGTKYQEKQ